LPALAQMTWALWQDERHRAAKLHLGFEVLRGIPVQARVTPGQGSETAALRALLEAGRIYVLDRGYGEYALFQTLLDQGSSFIARVCANTTWREVVQEYPVSAAALAAGVRSDQRVWLGGVKSGRVFKQPLRVVAIDTDPTPPGGAAGTVLLVTDLLELPAELIALAYRYRWSVELFFRWLKCILGCRHLLSHSENGLTLQVYLALIASLLISLWSGAKPCKATFTMLNFYLMGWADEAEVSAYFESLKRPPARRRRATAPP
jgi:DDE family transposase